MVTEERPTDTRVRCEVCGVYSAPHDHDEPVPAPDAGVLAAILAAGGSTAAQRRRR